MPNDRLYEAIMRAPTTRERLSNYLHDLRQGDLTSTLEALKNAYEGAMAPASQTEAAAKASLVDYLKSRLPGEPGATLATPVSVTNPNPVRARLANELGHIGRAAIDTGAALVPDSRADVATLGSAKLLGMAGVLPLLAKTADLEKVAERAASLRRQLAKAGVGMAPEKIRRAAEMGHDTLVFHGTNAAEDFPAFNRAVNESVGTGDFGIHADPTERVADKFASGLYRTDADELVDWDGIQRIGGRTLPLTAQAGNVLDLPDMGQWREPHNWLTNLEKRYPSLLPEGRLFGRTPVAATSGNKAIDDLHATANRYLSLEGDVKDAMQKGTAGYEDLDRLNTEFQEEILKVLDNHNINTIRYPNYTEGSGGPSYLFTRPNQLRSIFAEYNPLKAKSADLLASIAPVAVAGGAAAVAANKQGKK